MMPFETPQEQPEKSELIQKPKVKKAGFFAKAVLLGATLLGTASETMAEDHTPDRPSQEHQQVEPQKSPRFSDRVEEMRRQHREERAVEAKSAHDKITRVATIALKKGIAFRADSSYEIDAVANIPVSAKIDGKEVPFEKADFTPEEIQHINNVAHNEYYQKDHPEMYEIISRMGMFENNTVDTEKPESTSRPTTKPAEQRPAAQNTAKPSTTPGATHGNNYDNPKDF